MGWYQRRVHGAITRILEENDNDNNDNAAYTQTDKENTDTDNDNAAYTQTDKENTGTDNDNAADTEPDKQDTSFAYDHSDGSSTIKFNGKEFVISDDSKEWQWWVWAILVIAGMVVLSCLCKCLC